MKNLSSHTKLAEILFRQKGAVQGASDVNGVWPGRGETDQDFKHQFLVKPGCRSSGLGAFQLAQGQAGCPSITCPNASIFPQPLGSRFIRF